MRPIGECDLEGVGRLYAAAFPGGEVGDEATAIADVRASWDGEYGEWLPSASLLAEVDGRAAAAILVVDSPPWDDVSDLVFIIDLFTDPAHRGRGLGELLVRSALAAVEPGRVVGLRVEDENEGAVRLYRRLGFRERS
ncbi:GNAT family N-acetyltransferase [Ornithinimicrobium sp. F0845]|uniref:GNAT family N-acetyltransferase n=1 Tax=Ornithinimicrobium sp. F0845 TaxID=2926412 RepID=UPI001FF12A55|nr:GNAT family N-acetyltransferase [Ornithinimicrobium sp. F0845]